MRDAQYKKFDIHLVLQRLLEKGKIVFKKAYADWTRYSEYKREFHEAAIELIDIPQRNYSGKNSADIRMVVDAMDLVASKEHITTVRDLLGRLRLLAARLEAEGERQERHRRRREELDLGPADRQLRRVHLLRGPRPRDARRCRRSTTCPKKKQEVFRLLIDSIQALSRENKDVLWGSMVKQTMQRKKPYFNESYYGYRSFSELLEDAERHGIISMKKDAKSGGLRRLGLRPAGDAGGPTAGGATIRSPRRPAPRS